MLKIMEIKKIKKSYQFFYNNVLFMVTYSLQGKNFYIKFYLDKGYIIKHS